MIEDTTSRGPEQESPEPDMLPEYDFTGGVRGKYAERYAEGTNVVVLAPDVAEAFPNSQAVNHALRLLLKTSDREPAEIHRDTGEA
jgi:hypothetical protein